METINVNLSPSTIYNLGKCDGYTISKLFLPRTKSNKKELLRGTLTHLGIENYESKEVLANIKSNAKELLPKSEYQSLVEFIEVAKSREYLKGKEELHEVYLKPILIDTIEFKDYRINIFVHGTIDLLLIDRKSFTISIVDYKSSFYPSEKDKIQLLTYYWMLESISDEDFQELFKIDRNIISFELFIDYLRFDKVDIKVAPNINKISNILDSCVDNVSNLINIIQTKQYNDIKYNFGDQCKYCSGRGKCSIYKVNTHDFESIVNPNLEELNSEEIESELVALNNLQKRIEDRISFINKLIVHRREDNKFNRISLKPSNRRSIDNNLVKTNLLKVKDIKPEIILKDIIEHDLLKVSISSIKGLPFYLKRIVESAIDQNISKPKVIVNETEKPRI